MKIRDNEFEALSPCLRGNQQKGATVIMMTIDNGNDDYKEIVEMEMNGMGKNVLFFYYYCNKLPQSWWPEVCGRG